MKPAKPAKIEDAPADNPPRAPDKLPLGQVLRRLLVAKAKKPAPKPGKPPRKL